MKKLSVLAIALGAVACSDSSAPVAVSPAASATPRFSASSAAPAGSLIPDRYIVVFRESTTDVSGTARQLAAAYGASISFTYESALKGFAAQMSAAAAEAIARNPVVDYVEQDQVVSAIATETLIGGEPWGLDRIDARSGLDYAYNYGLTGSGVVAYIIDTGIRTTHSEFGGRATGGYTAIADGNGTNDCHGHGTHVAGTVGGATYGVAKAVSLVAVRVLDCSGSGSVSGVAAGVDWVTKNHIGASVANMSLGGGASTTLDNAVRNSILSGVSYAIAAGNGNQAGVAQDACGYSPARVAEAMTIGATTKSDSKTSWSNYGDCVDWFAPGSGITSSWYTSDDATATLSGTSMATPHVAGVAALYLQSNPSATAQQVRDALFDATTKGIVANSSTTNNNLLYSPPGGFGSQPRTNTAPTADFTYSCTNLSCQFTDASTDSDGSVTGWSWSFGDGGASTTKSPSYTYAGAGTYTVTLTVTDDSGATSTPRSRSVTVSSASTSGATLTATKSKTKGTWTAVLNWSGFDGAVTSFDVYRNGIILKTVSNTSSTTDSQKGGGTYTYKVCSAGSADNCTNEVTLSM